MSYNFIGVRGLIPILSKSHTMCMKCSLSQTSVRYGSTGLRTGMYNFPDSQRQVEISKDPQEWKFVEDLYPKKYIPNPSVPPGTILPSGWRKPSAKKGDYPYFVNRSKHHLLRIYLKIDIHSEERERMTKLCLVEGDLFCLAKELKRRIQELNEGTPELRVHEPHGQIHFKGDYVNYIKKILEDKGF